jgi:hypothetical protein
MARAAGFRRLIVAPLWKSRFGSRLRTCEILIQAQLRCDSLAEPPSVPADGNSWGHFMAKAAKRKRSTGSSGGGGSKSSVLIRTNAPHSTTLIISVVLFSLAILGALFPFIPIIGALGFWLALIGYLILVAGCVMKGL